MAPAPVLVSSPQAEAPVPPAVGAPGAPSRSSGPGSRASHQGNSPQRPCTAPRAGGHRPSASHFLGSPPSCRRFRSCPSSAARQHASGRTQFATAGHSKGNAKAFLPKGGGQKLLADMTATINLVPDLGPAKQSWDMDSNAFSICAKLPANAGKPAALSKSPMKYQLQCRERKLAHQAQAP